MFILNLAPRTKPFVQLICTDLCNALNTETKQVKIAFRHKWGNRPAVILPWESELSPTFSSCPTSFSSDNSAVMQFGTSNPEQCFQTSQGTDKELAA